VAKEFGLLARWSPGYVDMVVMTMFWKRVRLKSGNECAGVKVRYMDKREFGVGKFARRSEGGRRHEELGMDGRCTVEAQAEIDTAIRTVKISLLMRKRRPSRGSIAVEFGHRPRRCPPVLQLCLGPTSADGV
jgi:hypothetical protein